MLVRQDLQDIVDYLLPHHFPEESGEKQSAFGEGKTLCLLVLILSLTGFTGFIGCLFYFYLP